VEEDADSMEVGRGVEAEAQSGKIKCTVYILTTIRKLDV
jgi:hypothetical protein